MFACFSPFNFDFKLDGLLDGVSLVTVSTALRADQRDYLQLHTCSVMFALGLSRCPYVSVSISAECLDPLGREHRLPALFLSASVTAALHHLLVCSIHYSIA